MIRKLLVSLALAASVASGAFAVQPDEVLSDPALEARARSISAGLRCLVCQNESIDDSHAELARDLRLLVRERLVAGDTDDQVLDYMVVRYGEYVLLKPTAQGVNALLWGAAPAMALIALGVAVIGIRRRARAEGPSKLTAEEQRRLDEILNGK